MDEKKSREYLHKLGDLIKENGIQKPKAKYGSYWLLRMGNYYFVYDDHSYSVSLQSDQTGAPTVINYGIDFGGLETKRTEKEFQEAIETVKFISKAKYYE